MESYNGMGSYGGMGSYVGVGSYEGVGSYGMDSYSVTNPYTGMGPYSGYEPSMGMGPLNPDGTPSFTQTFEATTQRTFALIQFIVHTFTGIAQMLESTFMAAHSSFFAMIGVIDQFAKLRDAFGWVLGLFGVIRWLKAIAYAYRSTQWNGGF